MRKIITKEETNEHDISEIRRRGRPAKKALGGMFAETAKTLDSSPVTITPSVEKKTKSKTKVKQIVVFPTQENATYIAKVKKMTGNSGNKIVNAAIAYAARNDGLKSLDKYTPQSVLKAMKTLEAWKSARH